MDKIAVKKCIDYEYEKVANCVKQVIDALGGMEKFVQKGTKVLIKPNLLTKSNKEQCIVTNPAVVKAVAELVMHAGGEAVVADSPGGTYTKSSLENVYIQTGYKEDLKYYLNYNCEFVDTIFPNGKYLKKTKIIKPAIDADIIINLPKLKTHGFTKMSCCVKNLFGLVPGLTKAEYHMKFADVYSFCGALVDIATYAKPVLTLVDAVYSMEGQGPGSAGEPRHTGYIFASENLFALDAMCADFINIPNVMTNDHAKKQNLYTEYETIGDTLEKITDYKKPKDSKGVLKAPGVIKNIFNRFFSYMPHQNKEKCILCGECVRDCPAKAIKIVDKALEFDYKKCIKCLCCQELCPKEAIDLKRGK